MTSQELTIAKMMQFDSSYYYTCKLYDNLPYERTWELCNETTVGMYSGNVVKAFQYILQEPFAINNHDDDFEMMIH